MPSTLKRPSLGRLLASLRTAPSRGGTSFPVRTGFPTSLADLVVKNQGRLRKPRKPRRPDVLAPPSSTAPVALTLEVGDERSPPPSPVPLSPVAVRRLDASPRAPRSSAVFRLRPQLLGLGGAVVLAVLAVWSKGMVAAFTVAALSLLCIESATRRRRRPRETKALLLDSCGRGPVSPIREVDDEAPRSSCSGSDTGSEAPSATAGEDPTIPKLKAKRSLRKLISKKMQKKPNSKDSSHSFNKQPDAAAGDTADPALKTESSAPFSAEQTPSELSIEWSSSESELAVDRRGPVVKIPLGAWALAPVILAGLAVGKLPATALAMLCIVFSSAVQRL